MKIATSTQRLNELFDSDSRNDTAIANALGVSKQTVCAWKKGRRSPKKTVIVKIAEMFGVTLEWLMGFDVPKYPEEMTVAVPDSDLFGKLLRGMEPEDYRTVMQILERTEVNMRKKGLL